MGRLIIGIILIVVSFLGILGALIDEERSDKGTAIVGATIFFLIPGALLIYFGWRSREETREKIPHKAPVGKLREKLLQAAKAIKLISENPQYRNTPPDQGMFKSEYIQKKPPFSFQMPSSVPKWQWKWWIVCTIICIPFFYLTSLDDPEFSANNRFTKILLYSVFGSVIYYGLWVLIRRSIFLNRVVTEYSDYEKSFETNIDVFVSHSSRDKEIAQTLIQLLSAAIPGIRIRCTSVDGYRLPGGAHTEHELRREVFLSKYFIGLITPSSIESKYVLFELGTRWGYGLPMIPLLSAGTDPSILVAPLGNLNALSASSTPQLHQMIEEISRVLCLPMKETFQYEDKVSLLVELSKNS